MVIAPPKFFSLSTTCASQSPHSPNGGSRYRRKMVKPLVLASGREIQTWGIPIKVNEQLETRRLSVPGLDQHRAEILLELEHLAERQSA